MSGSIFMAALLIKRSVSKIPDVNPSNKYVIIHCCNFTIWVCLYALYTIGKETRQFTSDSASIWHLNFILIVFDLQNLFMVYVDCFLMW